MTVIEVVDMKGVHISHKQQWISANHVKVIIDLPATHSDAMKEYWRNKQEVLSSDKGGKR